MNSIDSIGNLSINDRKIIVGIDFGTTFSGIAWAETRRAEHQSVLESWPSSLTMQEGASSVKVPTELRYTPQGMEWGFQIPASKERHQWFKLGLEKDATGKAALVAGEPSRSPDDLTADYLTALYKHLMYTLEQKVGAVILRTIPMEFVLTVPAMWSDKAKVKTLRACQKAGIKSKSDIMLVSEPEAAAVYALHGLDPHGLSVGDTFVLCDAGGGTVDLISYSITELHPILKVKEAASGSGSLCGSTFLNRRFGDYLTATLGNEPGWDSEILGEAMERFESVIKKQFSPTTAANEGFSIMVPGLANNERLGIRRGRFTIKAANVKGIFEPVVSKIIDLVKGQIKATKTNVKAILLVGGFGQNNYLKERLRSELGSSVSVLQPANSWTAVVRGAVMMGLAKTNSSLATVAMQSRAARKHYGIGLSSKFDKKKHLDSEKYWHDRDRMYRVRHIGWFIKKGDVVQESKPKLLEFSTHFKVSDGPSKMFETLRVYYDEISDTAPVHKNKNVKELATLQADLSHLSESELKSSIVKCADGNSYYEIRGAVEATYYSASTTYVLLYRGKRYDTVTAEYV